VHYKAIHLHPYYETHHPVEPGALPVATDLSARTLSLPFGPKLSEQDLVDVVDGLNQALNT
jgi:dTDP-4-amino-4,6-dideoxygalactose transaminase